MDLSRDIILNGFSENELHDIYASLLSGLTRQTGNEIHWRDKYGYPITVEIVNSELKEHIIRMYYKSGQKRSERLYIDGLRYGVHSKWYEHGGKRSEASYHSGVSHGKETDWYSNGIKYREYFYSNGKRDGCCLQWYPCGQKQREEHYCNGKLDGICLEYYQNGVVACSQRYDSNGNLTASSVWDTCGKKIFYSGDC